MTLFWFNEQLREALKQGKLGHLVQELSEIASVLQREYSFEFLHHDNPMPLMSMTRYGPTMVTFSVNANQTQDVIYEKLRNEFSLRPDLQQGVLQAEVIKGLRERFGF